MAQLKHRVSHAWGSEIAFIQIHASTGLRFVCIEREHYEADDDEPSYRWHVTIDRSEKDQAEIDKEAAQSDMLPDAYIEFLREMAVGFAVEDQDSFGGRP